MSYKDSKNDNIIAPTRDIHTFGSDNFDLATLFPDVGDSSTLVVTTHPDNYCASILARAVEDCDAHLLNLNVGRRNADDDRIVIYLRVNLRNAEGVARSIERFGYDVIGIDSPDISDAAAEEARDRINQLIRIFGI